MGINTTFDIEIDYAGPAQFQNLFIDAANRWEQIIVGDIDDVNNSSFGFIDDLLIDAEVVFIDGVGGILGQAGPDEFRNGSLLPFHGIMEFDSADAQQLFDNGTLFEVILHEMAHVLGLGTLWNALGLINTTTHRYFGAQALAEYRLLSNDPGAAFIPIEDGGGAGTANSHWEESLFDNELMTGFIEFSSVDMPISRMTIASLADLGYLVNLNAADTYNIPGIIPGPAIIIGDDNDNTLNGTAGNDTLRGLGGNDKLFGFDGNDVLIGDSGADILTGGTGIDEAAYSTSSVGVTIDMGVGLARGGDAAGDLFGSIENLIGSSFDDFLGGDNANNFLYGLEGNDTLRGDSGDDIFIGGVGADNFTGGTGIDAVSYHNAGNSIRIVLFQLHGRFGEAEGDVFGSIEDVIGSQFSDELFGDNAANSLFGLGGNDNIEGDGGNDRLDGGEGLDKLLGQDGNDILIGGLGQDRLFGGAGADNFFFASITDSTLSSPDEVVEFTRVHGDLIDLSRIDANISSSGDQAFTFIGGAAFNGVAGQLNYVGLFLEGDVDGDGTADFRIQFNNSSLQSSDFVL